MEGIPEYQPTDIDVLKKMEDEHLRLQRQVRMIQVDRLHRTMGVHPQFRRQDKHMGRLKKEYRNLCKDLKIARSGAHKKKDRKMKQDLKDALFYRALTEQNCEAEVTMMNQINGLVEQSNKENLELLKVANATQGRLKERRCQAENRLISTENKLETATLRFNAVQYENKKIREEIEHMLQDRALFNQAWEKMLGALSKGKKFLLDLFESSTLAYDQRDEWCNKLKSMQEKGKIDQMLQVQEMRDLISAYDHEMKVYLFLAAKGMIRINRKQEKDEEDKKRLEDENLKNQHQYHFKLLQEIYEYTQVNHEDQILDLFEKKEQENFSMYRLLTETCAENEVLSRDLKAVRQTVYDRRDFNEMKENKAITKIQRLRETLADKQKKTEDLRNRVEEKKQLIHNVMSKITEMFSMLDCSLEPFQHLLGDKRPSVNQLTLSLRLITEKIIEHIENLYYYERFVQRKGDKSSSRLKKYTVQAATPHFFKPIPLNVLVPADPCPSCVEARWLSRISEGPEAPFDATMARNALQELSVDPAYVRSDRVHTIVECIVPRSRAILAKKYTMA